MISYFNFSKAIAGNDGVREAAKKAKPVILEPIMGMEVVMPENKLGDIIGDLSGQRGQILDQYPDKGGTYIVKAAVPLSELFGYATTMRRLTRRFYFILIQVVAIRIEFPSFFVDFACESTKNERELEVPNPAFLLFVIL